MTVHLRVLLSAFLIVIIPLLNGCSGDQEKKEKSAIEKRTDKAAQQAVEMIKVPLDQAKMAAEQENINTLRLEEQGKKP